jgi:hypothetical protein
MFAPLLHGEPIAVDAKVIEVLGRREGGATAALLADDLLRSHSAVGLKQPVTARIQELLEELEQAARVERIPDGRFRVVRRRG